VGAGLTESRVAITAQLRKVLDSRFFRRSELLTEFLSFVVTMTLENRAEEIKEYSIGVEAFGRGPEFDPRIDSVVRVVARRVRDKLADYYRGEGKSDPIVIEIRAGSYVPSFTTREPPEAHITEPALPSAASSPADSRGRTPDIEETSDVGEAPIRPKGDLDPNESAAAISDSVNPRSLLRRTWVWVGTFAFVLAICAIYLVVRPDRVPRILGYKQLTDDGQGKLGAFAGTPPPLVTDGSRIYFNEVSGARVMIEEVSVSGGDEISLDSDLKEPLVLADISPDRSRLLVTQFFQRSADQQLFTLALPSGSARALENTTGHSGAWSPDGKQICYAQGNRLFVSSADGGGSRLLAEFPGTPSWPRWSRDGSRLRLTVQDASGGTSLWEVSLREPRPHALLPGWNDHPAECCGSWDPEGKYFMFQSTREGSTGLWALRDGWSIGKSKPIPVQLTESPFNVWGPTFSADGHKIFAVVQQRRGELVRYDPGSHEFRPFLNGISADHVEFSRDGRWIAYSTYPEQTIWRRRPDGSERRQLSFAPMAAIFSRWSPDGRRIAFMGTLPGKPVEIFTVSVEGGNPEPLIPGDDSIEIDPNWSPNGESIMFARLRSTPAAIDDDSSIQILDLKKKKLSMLPGSQGLTAPRWSPDGSQVVATSLSHGKWNHPAVMIFDFKSQSWQGLEDDPIDNKWWSYDGKYFYFDKLMENDPAIYRIRLSDRAIERIVSLKQIRRSLNIMGWWSGLTPAGDPMVLRDTSIEEIYALDWDVR
jgi:Tol biopolymer transport system component